jgi:lactoylglutathione lyase
MKKTITLKLLIVLFTFTMPVFCQAQDNSPSINHVAICVHDLKKSTAFYTDVVQLKKIPHPFKDTIHTWFSMGGGVQLHLIQANCPPVEHNINIHLCFKVPSLADFMKHLDAYNIKYGNWAGDYKKTQTRPDGVVQIYFQDPDGYWIEINDSK